jgi:hypothetical protein
MRAILLSVLMSIGVACLSLPVGASDGPKVAPQSETAEHTAEFLGYLQLGKRMLFAVADKPIGEAARRGWAEKGGQIGQIRIKDFDPKSETLFVQLPTGRIVALNLPEARVRDGDLPKVNREEALRVLRKSVDDLAGTGSSQDLNYDIGSVTDNQRMMIQQVRDEAKRTGGTPLVARKQDGTLFMAAVPPYPEALIPSAIRGSLTDEDMKAFQLELAIASFQRNSPSVARTEAKSAGSRPKP